MLAVSVGRAYLVLAGRRQSGLDPIWRNEPDILGAKVNVSPMILYALTLC